ncbi:MAG: phosphoribosyl-AMP cyclohydrolase [Henriciella sp.]|jgi:phosphoribosyl-AMP cyclohydrolase|uniref:phosphoribosyl-AMP cyclohydrolase n=1 Tax=Henriciella sp. TaxID=1968823 RepID=UPI000C11F585|nr:phosphoribosyl-AMP cyclohydrolase [Henriciella sp.]MAN73996.1 phosphoribosyl-AMP cyclohydrolase [Henriciella sp.]MBF35275.1 phosphoribosyl-AMP cyclohydrolase [Hyphomonadaceae bacterium]MBK76162.1 phosphoribosyl-AMP cyclohydrolase [Henriciella sp.]PHR82452.1 MAG: phosphoribosyl-AMP cyclohydrolase [Henriciella sp.]|tara:strand:+ start:294 stop:692 length:399 start_codon:yes stop_codon:yes gene_type:complete
MTDFKPPLSGAAQDEAKELRPKFNADGLIPAIAQDEATGEILMMAWMNDEALRQTIETGEATYFSRSRGKLWRKGETSGNTQTVERILIDCDQDTLLLKVTQKGPACHTDRKSCFYREVSRDGALSFTGEEA